MSDHRIFNQVRIGIWIYFYLLIFEGALRKWVLPGLAQPLLIIRDPLGLWIIFRVIQYNLWKPNKSVVIIWVVSALSFITALLVGHGSVVVALYGLRITLIHFPIMFIVGSIFDKKDVVQMGKAILWINIIMTLLVAVQFYSPQSAWVNRGIGGDEAGSGFGGAAGFLRVPGTFSFTNGLSLFYGFATSYIFYFWLNPREEVSRTVLIISTLALLAAIPLSISRSVLFQVILSVTFMVLISSKNPKVIKSLIGGAIGITLMSVILSFFTFFQTSVMVFTTRFDNASKVEGGIEGTIFDRFLGGSYSALVNDDATFFGLGLGMGTNAGSQLLTGGKTFLISEGEWGRLIGEMGFVLGMIMIIIRMNIVATMFIKSWKVINKGNTLPWMLLSFGAITLLQGQWAQPTALGFSTLIGGLIIAAFNNRKEIKM